MSVRSSVAAALVTALLATVAFATAATAATGPDVSSWQHPNGAPIDWGQVRAAGHTFTFVKADEGPSTVGRPYYTNPYFAQDWRGAGAVGLYRGAYHYGRPKLPLDTAIGDARHFVSVTGSMQGPLDLPPVLDLEESGGLAPADVAAWARTWLREVERLTGRPPIIYTGYYFWRDRVGAPVDFGRYPLWIANWTAAQAPSPIPAGWATWTFWQYTATGSSPGIPWTVDLNRFCCPDANLGLLAGRGNPAYGNPFGSLDGARRTSSTIDISGWAIDPDSTGPVSVHVYVDGSIAGATVANGSRPDVGAAYPGFGSGHGYTFSAPVGPGAHTICAYAINTGPGNANTQLGCRTLSSDPLGSLDGVAQEPGGGVRVSGWAFDADAGGPIDVTILVNGQRWDTARADRERPDLALAGFDTTRHGFSHVLGGLTTAPVDVCAVAANVGPGSARNLGCRRIDAQRLPRGSLDSVTVADGGVRVRGWALDPDTAGPIQVHVYLDGRFDRVVDATASRPDVGAAYPGWGAGHGFDVVLPDLAVTDHEVCVFAINVGFGWTHPPVGCKRVRPAGEPFGSSDALERVASGYRVAGWVIDPDTTAPVDVVVTVDGAQASFVADRDRPDVARAFPGFGSRHGFDTVVAATPGAHDVCVWGRNVGRGMGDRLLACRRL